MNQPIVTLSAGSFIVILFIEWGGVGEDLESVLAVLANWLISFSVTSILRRHISVFEKTTTVKLELYTMLILSKKHYCCTL